MAYRYGTLCYIHLMATRPDRQRQGAGWAALAAAITTAIDDGAEGIYLLASDPGRFLYTPMGFRLVEEVRFWVANPPQPVEADAAATR
jgi:GNAT superfamily N-acetyltransferase